MLTCGALALVVVDLVDALPIVEAGHAIALISIDLAEDSLVPCQLAQGNKLQIQQENSARLTDAISVSFVYNKHNI